MPSDSAGQPWTQEMVIVHRAMRTAFHQAPALVRSCPAARVGQVRRHIRDLLNGLHHHHTAEDELLWPRLRDRVPTDGLRRIEAAEGQHADLEPLIARAAARLDRWHRHPGPVEAEDLAAALSGLGVALGRHMDCEENELLPLVAEYLTVREWRAVARRAARGLPKARLLVALGDLVSACRPEEKTRFLQRVPLPARIVWHLAGPRAHARHHARLRLA